jgi:hypothetical protein
MPPGNQLERLAGGAGYVDLNPVRAGFVGVRDKNVDAPAPLGFNQRSSQEGVAKQRRAPTAEAVGYEMELSVRAHRLMSRSKQAWCVAPERREREDANRP